MSTASVNQRQARATAGFTRWRVLVAAAISFGVGALAGCSPSRSDAGAGEGTSGAAVADRTIEAVLEDSTNAWLERPGVTGTALGRCDGAPCIVVYVVDDRAGDRFPDHVEGHPIDVRVSGRIRALDRDSS